MKIGNIVKLKGEIELEAEVLGLIGNNALVLWQDGVTAEHPIDDLYVVEDEQGRVCFQAPVEPKR